MQSLTLGIFSGVYYKAYENKTKKIILIFLFLSFCLQVFLT